jgi:hypothetical protein
MPFQTESGARIRHRACYRRPVPGDRLLRDHVVALLRSENAHVGFERVIGGWPERLRGVHAEGLPHTGWQLLEHLRLAQVDILDYTRDPEHESPPWPEGYWPPDPAPPNRRAWNASVERFRHDLEAMCALVADPTRDLLEPFPWIEDGPTLLREALLLADHNAYHLGQMVDLRRALGCWER